MSLPRGFHPFNDALADFADLPASAARATRSLTHFNTPISVERQRQWRPAVGNGIHEKGKKLAPQVGDRVAMYYRRLYPKNTAKHLANEAGCSIDTAKNWITGSCPANEHLFAMWSRHGDSFFAFVFAPVAPSLAKMAELAEETNDIHRRIKKLHEALGDE